jgi:uncharacterized damage-inducible protein DinB
MNASDLRYLYDLNRLLLQTNAAGLTHDESVRAPEPAGNCLNWVLGHIVATRHPILKLVRQEGWWPAETIDLYKRGSQPLSDGTPVRRWEALIEDYDRSQALLFEGLDRMTPEDLAAPGGKSPTGEVDVAGRLAFLQFHEAYHIGQIGLLRRLAGREGAIR